MQGAPRQIGLSWILAGIVCGFATFNFLTFALGEEDRIPDVLHALLLGVWVFEPMLFGVWAALGPGRFLVRLLLIVPCLVLIVAAPGVYRPNFYRIQRYEFITVSIAAVAIFAAVSMIFLVGRRLVGWRIEDISSVSPGWRPFQFGTKHLIALITLYAVAMGVTTSLRFGPAKPPPFLFGPNFVIYALSVGSAICFFVLLPLLAVPLLVLRARPSDKFLRRAIAVWFLATLGITTFMIVEEGEDVILLPVMIQSGAAVAGILTAVPLRWAGYRFTNQEQPLAIHLPAPKHD